MLKKFFMNALSSFVGAWIALALFGVVAVIVCVGILAKFGVSDTKSATVSKGSVLSISLEGVIEERETPVDINYLSLMQGEIERPQTLTQLVASIEAAKENRNISAIYLNCKGVSASPATLNALREALSDFRKSGKKVIAYGGSYMMGDYYVASVADSVFLNPAGIVGLQGLGGTSFYFKGLLDKLGVSMQVVKVGTYKSAVEPYILEEMSAPARAQLDTLYGNMWNVMRENMASSRKGLTAAMIDSLVNDFIFVEPAEKDLSASLVDRLVYERTVDSVVASVVGVDYDKLNYVSPSALVSQIDWNSGYNSKKRIAVLYACGEIVDGGGNGTINYQKLVPQIVSLADDESVKGMVLRVNSPGGAVFGSDQIGEALDYFQSKGKPLAVSMGDYAASGGYWISSCADRIFADPLTITGSIGIFGLIPDLKGLADKIGVSPQHVSTNPEADFPTLFSPMTEKQKAAMQANVERGYDRFVARVARGRKMEESKVRAIGEGRVWDAVKAKEIGLVDELGSVKDATEWVAQKSGLGESYDVAAYPLVETGIWDVIPELGGMRLHEAMAKAMAGEYDALTLRYVSNMLRQKPLQARMPYMRVGFGETITAN
ncbi:MAG: signal peptide peptidase SppA [Muribaculaceae bacterium]|nr:signal peptide peptidase SppA [Muribaculaceae bacterium]